MEKRVKENIAMKKYYRPLLIHLFKEPGLKSGMDFSIQV